MQARDFCFWLQGFFELTAGKDELTAEQGNMIRTHLALVFQHDAGIKKAEMEHVAQLPLRPARITPYDNQSEADNKLATPRMHC